MKIKMTKEMAREILGDIIYLGTECKMKYDQDKKEYTDEVQSAVINLGCEKLEESITVQVKDLGIPNVKKFGKVEAVNFVYDPKATGSSFVMEGRTLARGTLVEHFECDKILPATPNDRLADENGEKLEGKADTKK